MPRPPPALAPAPRSRLSRRAGFAVTLASALALACESSKGEVELNWTVVDAAGRSIFPAGNLQSQCDVAADKFGDLCEFIGRTAPDGPRRPYSLRAQLRLCEPDCPQECADDESCQVETLRYHCNAARGFSTVPAREEPYIFDTAVVADFGDGCTCELGPSCALTPGPRMRSVEPGLVTDLQVYLFVLTGLDACAQLPPEEGRTVMDLDGCCELDPTCS